MQRLAAGLSMAGPPIAGHHAVFVLPGAACKINNNILYIKYYVSTFQGYLVIELCCLNLEKNGYLTSFPLK